MVSERISTDISVESKRWKFSVNGEKYRWKRIELLFDVGIKSNQVDTIQYSLTAMKVSTSPSLASITRRLFLAPTRSCDD